jgi:hypothetical protein
VGTLTPSKYPPLTGASLDALANPYLDAHGLLSNAFKPLDR